jgi:hypothetical protein
MTSRAPAPLSILVLAALAAACAPNSTPVTKRGYQGKPPLGERFTAEEAPVGSWSWVPFPDALCGDGSTAGLGVNAGIGPDLVVYFDGGGACWDYVTCETAETAIDRRYGTEEFATEVSVWFPGSIMDRAALPPSLSDATLVFVPYCTGDVHGGDHVETHHGIAGSATWHHVGHANLMRFLERVGPSVPSPRKLVVAGSSAGGFGALANYEAFRWYFPDAQGFLVDDSGPPLVGGDLPGSMRDAWYNAWHLGASLDLFCVECREDMSAAISALAQAHRGDRLALVSHLRDLTMSTFLLQPTPLHFEEALRRLERDVFAATDDARVFYDDGYDHTLLPAVADHVTGAMTLSAWLEEDVSGGSGWVSVSP